MKHPALVTICAIVATVLIVAYLLAYPDMSNVKLNSNCFLSHIEPCAGVPIKSVHSQN